MGKLCWHFSMEEDQLWKQVIKEKYYIQLRVLAYGVGLQKAIRREWNFYSKC